MKQEKGIAKLGMCSVVISVLILAGVTISSQIDDEGVLNKTISAVNEYSLSSAKEKVELLATSYLIDYYDEKYLQGEMVDSVMGDYVAKKFDEYIASKDKIEDYTFTTSGKFVTLENENSIAKGKINDDGSINWNIDNL